MSFVLFGYFGFLLQDPSHNFWRAENDATMGPSAHALPLACTNGTHKASRFPS